MVLYSLDFFPQQSSLLYLTFGQRISIITTGSLPRRFHFTDVFRPIDASPLSSPPVWGQAGPAATLCWTSCWIWPSVKEWWTFTTVSRPSARGASTWSRLKWVGGRRCAQRRRVELLNSQVWSSQYDPSGGTYFLSFLSLNITIADSTRISIFFQARKISKAVILWSPLGQRGHAYY